MTPGPLHIVSEDQGLALFFGSQQRIARVLAPEYAAVFAASPGLVSAAQTVAKELERMAEGVGVDAASLRWCASALRDALPRGVR